MLWFDHYTVWLCHKRAMINIVKWQHMVEVLAGRVEASLRQQLASEREKVQCPLSLSAVISRD